VAQFGAFGRDETAPDAVLADIPVLQRQFQALGAYRAGPADGDRGARLTAGDLRPGADREPVIGVKHTPGAPRVAVHLGPQRQVTR
jgi:hypothetical protein